LLLLAYLAIAGKQDREKLATLFWWDAVAPRNNLSSTLTRIRPKLPDVIQTDKNKTFVWVDLPTDYQQLKDALTAKDYQQATKLYTGTFLQGFNLPNLGEELEEWRIETQDELLNDVREAYLKLAEKEASQSNFRQASEHAEEAYKLSTLGLEPEELNRYYTLLLLNNSPLVKKIEQDADSYGITLKQTQDEAKRQLKRTFLGREKEIERLESLENGQWAWVKGGVGIGKSSLLKKLEGNHLISRSKLS